MVHQKEKIIPYYAEYSERNILMNSLFTIWEMKYIHTTHLKYPCISMWIIMTIKLVLFLVSDVLYTIHMLPMWFSWLSECPGTLLT